MYYSVKPFAKGLALTVLLAGLSHHAVGQQHGDGDSGHEHSGEPMGMMNQDKMMAMDQHMQDMQSLMAEIREEDDPERRQQLMQEHMQQMQSSMGMMEGMMAAGPDNAQTDSNASSMQKMQNRMEMMQKMMRQMMSHMQQQGAADPADN
jgi:hypothetical protein